MKNRKIIIALIIGLFMSLISFNKVYAASAKISVSANKSQVIVGDTVTVTVKVSSGELLGSWRWTIDYNSSKFKLSSGDSTVADAGDGKLKSKTYTYKFKAIATGSSSIGVKNVDVLTWSEKNLSVSKNTKTIKVITQSDYQASLSKNNYLSSLTVGDLTLSPTFKKDVTEYTVSANANTTNIKISAKAEDSKSDVDGTGTFNVSEGDNKFVITVTAQNRSVKKYTVIVSVTDPNPINITIDNKEYVVVKREANLEAPANYEKKELTISNQKIPGFYNEVTGYTLIGLKNSNGETNLFIYDEDANKYSKYNEVNLDKIKLYPLEMNLVLDDYINSSIEIDDTIFEALKREKSEYYIIHAKDLDSGEEDYYTYDSKTNTVIRYTDEEVRPYKESIKKYTKLLSILIVETLLIILVLIGILINKVAKDKKKREKFEKLKKEKEEREKNKKVNKKAK